jgi:DNA replication protein DnaC
MSRIIRAKLPWDWTLDSFPFEQQPGINKTQIMGLAKLAFIERGENIVFIGKPGTGKSGLAMGLLRIALLAGHRGRYYNAQDMISDLYASMADRTSTQLLKSLSSYDILVIDELGYLNLNPEQINMFFKLIDMRYQKKATIITTNLDYSEWYSIFKNKELVDAMLDRLKHHCTTIQIDGPSLRSKKKETKKSK